MSGKNNEQLVSRDERATQWLKGFALGIIPGIFGVGMLVFLFPTEAKTESNFDFGTQAYKNEFAQYEKAEIFLSGLRWGVVVGFTPTAVTGILASI